MKDYPQVEIGSLEDWHDWLSRNADTSDSIWLIRWKKGEGPYVPYDELVDEALCFGWIDSLPRRLDESRSMLLMSPRRPGSGWSTVNKGKIERLREAGRLTPRGIAIIEAAIQDGSWTRLDSAGALEVADDLAQALKHKGARKNFDTFPASARRGILEWIDQAKRPETRRQRIEATASAATEDRRVK
jgi:uncharacterized protein YdeI (YjbR/CyaY-like superfamily)